MLTRQHIQKAYIFLLAVAALSALLVHSTSVHPDDWHLFLLLAGGSTVLGLRSIYPDEESRDFNFDFSSAIGIFSILVAGLPVALWSTVLSVLVVHVIHGRPFKVMVANVSQYALHVLAAGLVFEGLGGLTGQAFNHPLQAFAAGLTLMAVNVLSMFLIFLTEGLSVRETALFFYEDLRHMHYVVSLMLGTLAGFIHVQGNYTWTVFVLLFVFLFQGTFKRYFGLFLAANHERNRFEAVLNATHSAIMMADRAGHIRVANLKYAELVGMPIELIVGQRLADLPSNEMVRAVNDVRARSELQAMKVEEVVTVTTDDPRHYHWYRGPVHGQESRGEGGTIEVLTDMTAEREALEKLRQVHLAMIQALTAAVDARDAYTHGHSARVSEYAVVICQRLGFSAEEIERIRCQGLLHDVGKIGIDDRILRKRGPLSPNERAMMMEHPMIGARILEKSGVFKELIPGVLWHHEWINGGGYPHGLKGAEIPRDARILCVADSFDAMTSDRPYRRALTPEHALRELHAHRGEQFDPLIVDAFTAALADGDIQVKSHHVPAQPMEEASESELGVIRPVHGKELNIVYQVSRETQNLLNLNTVLSRFLEIFYDAIGQNAYMVFLKDDTTTDLILREIVGHDREYVGERVHGYRGVVGEATQSGKTVYVPDVSRHATYWCRLLDTRSELAVPLLWDGEAIGVLNVESVLLNAFSKDDVYLFEALAQQLSSAIELARYHERVVYAAQHDGLTGAFNHSIFYDRLTQEIAKAKEGNYPVSVVILDLDGLKQINDTYGHLAGDQALRQYAQVLREYVRSGDTLARYGGDEFALILINVDKNKAFTLLENIAQSARQQMPVDDKWIPLPGGSYGVATFPVEAERPAELVALADRMMYENKARKWNPRRTAETR